MLDVLLTRWKQGHRTMRFPYGPPPELPDRFVGRPVISASSCEADCRRCVEVCPTGAIALSDSGQIDSLDTGRCLFCRECANVCNAGLIAFSQEYRLAAAERGDLVVRRPSTATVDAASRDRAMAHESVQRKVRVLNETAKRLFGHSLKLRQVSAGGCNACEADTNVLGTLAWDLGRFGIQFVASPRHADGILVTGPVSENMRDALRKTYEAVPAPKLVIAVGACAISGGPYADCADVHNGATDQLPVSLFIPGCPPHPLTILDGLLAFLGRIAE